MVADTEKLIKFLILIGRRKNMNLTVSHFLMSEFCLKKTAGSCTADIVRYKRINAV